MNVGSLFSGIGGFDLGLERAGMRTEWFVEQDEFCQRVLNEHWPNRPIFDDVRHVCGQSVWPERRYYLPPVDVLCGGFPCQDLSVAGRGAGLAGARSGLWSEYARLVGELRPRYVIVENVSALLGRGLGAVLGDLAALGYDAEWDCIPASAVGAPHQRDRIWLVAYPEGAERRRGTQRGSSGNGRSCVHGAERAVADSEVIPIRSGLRSHEPRGERRGRPCDGGCSPGDVADTDEQRRRQGIRECAGELERPWPGNTERSGEYLPDADERALQPWRVGGRAAQAGGSEWWSVEPPVGRVAHGVPNRLDQLAALGNALVPQIAQWIGERIMSYEAR